MSALPRRTEFNLRSVLVGFLMAKVALGWVFLSEYFRFPSPYYSSTCPYANFFHQTSTLYNPSNLQRRYVEHFSHPSFPPQHCVIIFHRDANGSGTQPVPCSMVNEGFFPELKWLTHDRNTHLDLLQRLRIPEALSVLFHTAARCGT
jgi:hypothetical protein